MKNENTLRIAKAYNITEIVNRLEASLLKISGIVDVEFGLNGFYDNMNQVIFLTKYEIPPGSIDYYGKRRRLLADVIDTAQKHGLTRTEDSIEDHGEHFYFVFSCDKTWLHDSAKETEPIEREE